MAKHVNTSNLTPVLTDPIYGCMFSSNMPASFSPMLAGLAYDRTGSFAVPLAVIAALTIVAVGLISRVSAQR